jgi:hypothetical protein
MSNLSEFQSEHLFLLVGTNPLPDYVAAKLLQKSNGTIYFVHTDETIEIARRLAQLLGLNNEKTNYISVDESNSDDVFYKIDNVCKKIGKEYVGLNYTGGTKTMVVHAYRAIEANCQETVFSYLHARSLRMIVEQRDQPSLEFPVSLSVLPKIQDLLALHGYSLKHDPITQPFKPDVCRELVKIGCREWREWCDKYLRNSKGLREEKELKTIRLPAALPSDRMDPIWQGCQTLGDLAALWGLKINKLAEWLDGRWLEHYTLWALQQIASECQIQQCGMSFEPIERDFEFDVTAMRGYQLFALSCTTGSKKSDLKSKLFEAYVRAKQMGGEEARIGLVCCAPKDNPKNNPAVIQKEIEETWDAQGMVRVFGAEHLSDLQSHLREWFKSQPK